MFPIRRLLIVAVFVFGLVCLLRSSSPISTTASSPSKSEPSTTTWASSPAATELKTNSAKFGGRNSHTSQQTLVDISSKPLRDRLAYQFPYDLGSKFPAFIWQTWKFTPGQGEFDEGLRPAEATWSIKHPGFVHEVITDDVAVHLISHLYASIPEVVEAYNALPLPILKADFFRYLILLARGGIYSDIDTAALRSATEWIPEEVSRSTFGLVIGIEADPDREDWARWYSRRIQFCQWTIQSKPGHPILLETVAHITEETLKRRQNNHLGSLDKTVIEFTGPALWTDKIFDFFNNEKYFDMGTGNGNITWQNFTGMTVPKKVGDVIVLPITSFSPGVKQMGAGEDDDPMAFVKHEFVGSWKPESERHIGEK
ncbi:MAG: membrane-bound alpha-1,6- mannosyltransferase Initiation-specific [Trizodia sp. TS-e1964]|nr:MAG: membrane-bound alpha-1,6- mannosyltransferase Initiation-specific [Trizodia sp. TS-e1964]